MTGGMHTKAVEAVAKYDRVLTDAAYNLYAYGFIDSNNWKEAEWRDAKRIIEWYNQNKTATVFNDKGTGQYRQLDPMREVYTWIAKNPNEWNQMVKDNTKPIEQVIFETTGYRVDPKTLQPVDKEGGGGGGHKGQGAMTGIGINQPGTNIIAKSISDRINTLLNDKTLDKFQIRTLGETFKIPEMDKLNNLLNSDKLKEAKDYLSQKLSEIIPDYKPYEKSAWKTPGSNFTPDRSGICLSACQAACQSAQTSRGTCGSSQTLWGGIGGGAGSGGGGGGSACGHGESYCTTDVCGQAERLERWDDPRLGKGGTCWSSAETGCSIAQAYVGSGGYKGCEYDLSGRTLTCTSEAGGLPVENKGSQGGNVPMEYCSGGQICSQGESCDSDVEAAQISCRGCETVWQMGCMSKELGMRKKK